MWEAAFLWLLVDRNSTELHIFFHFIFAWQRTVLYSSDLKRKKNKTSLFASLVQTVPYFDSAMTFITWKALYTCKHHISSTAEGWQLILFFHTKWGLLFEGRWVFEGGGYFKYCSPEVVTELFCFISLQLQGIKEKVKYMNITIEKTVTKPAHSNNQIKARLLFKVSTFNLTGRE